MKTKILIVVLNCFILVQVSQANPVTRVGWTPPPSPGPMPKPTAPPPPQQSAPTTPPPTPSTPLERTPKCYPETAKAYFLPAPPSSPKVTVLDQNLKDLPSCIKSSLKEIPPSSTLASNIMSNRPSFSPPPSSVSVLPDLIDEIPTLVQNRLTRMGESDVKVCDTCASMIGKLPIFKFDQELLDGFLVGLGL